MEERKYLGADSLVELLALLMGHVYGEVLATLVWHLLALSPWHLLLHLIGTVVKMMIDL